MTALKRTRQRGKGVLGAATAEPWSRSFQGGMLLEDVRLGVMPIGGRTQKRTQFLVGLAEGGEEDAVITMLTDENRHGRRDLAPAVCDWIVGCVHFTFQLGSSQHDIVRQGDGVRIRHRAEELDPRIRLGERLVDTRVASLPRKHLADFTAMTQALPRISDPLTVGRLFGYLGDTSQDVPFEYDVFRQSEGRALARATAFTGWNGRGVFASEHDQNSYHQCYRELKFHAFKASLRERAVICLNECLEVAGREIGKALRIEVVGLPSEKDALDAIQELERGRRGFKEILDGLLI